MDNFFNECQDNVINKNYKVRKYLDLEIDKNKKDAKYAAEYVFSLLISDKIFKNKLRTASKNGKKREIIFKYYITERIFIPLLSKNYNIDFLITGRKGADIQSFTRFGIEPVYSKFEKYINPFKSRLIIDQNFKYIEVIW